MRLEIPTGNRNYFYSFLSPVLRGQFPQTWRKREPGWWHSSERPSPEGLLSQGQWPSLVVSHNETKAPKTIYLQSAHRCEEYKEMATELKHQLSDSRSICRCYFRAEPSGWIPANVPHISPQPHKLVLLISVALNSLCPMAPWMSGSCHPLTHATPRDPENHRTALSTLEEKENALFLQRELLSANGPRAQGGDRFVLLYIFISPSS